MPAPTILNPGAKVGGKYEVVEVIGYGGMGLVYKVREQVGAVSRIRALKTVLPQYASDAAIVARFRQEAEKMCMLEHENIVPVLSYSEEGEFPYLVMPFIEGQTLKDYLAAYIAENGHPLPLADVMTIGLGIVDALEVAHHFVNPETRRPQPMIHRDIKPGNVMVRVEDRGGARRLRVLVMDFGIAKVVSDQDTGHSLTDVIGTVKYASPEQVRRGKDIDPRADIYSLGMVLYELYCGRHVFANLSEHMILMKMMQREVEDIPVEFPEGTPEAFRRLILRCVVADRERRFADVRELRTVLRRILEEDSERLVIESDHAREQAAKDRSGALEAGAAEVAAEPLAAADELVARAERARAERDYKAAIALHRQAREAFERIAADAARERRRRQIAADLASLAALRDAAREANADRLAADELRDAERLTQEAERALVHGDLTASARARGQAEKAWRDAQAKALRAAVRERAEHAVRTLDEALDRENAELEALAEAQRSPSGQQHLDRARAAAEESRRALAADDFDRARAAAEGGLVEVEAAGRARRQHLEEMVQGLERRVRSELEAAEAADHPALVPELYAEATRTVAMAEATRAAGRLAEAGRHLERALDATMTLTRAARERAAELEAAARDAEARARAVRAEAEAERARGFDADRAGDRARELRRQAEAAWDAGEEATARADHRAAVGAYRGAAEGFRAAGRVARDHQAKPEAEAAMDELRRAAEDLVAAGGPDRIEATEHGGAETQAAEGRRLFASGEYADASPLLRSAAARLVRIARASAGRRERERLEARYQEVRRGAEASAKALASLGESAASDAETRRLFAALSQAGGAPRAGDAAAAVREIEELAAALDGHLEAMRARVERERAQAAAAAAQKDAYDARRALLRFGLKAAGSDAYAAAEKQIEDAERRHADDPAAARAGYEQAAQALRSLESTIEAAEHADRTAYLRLRSSMLAARFSALPDARALRRGRRAGLAALRRADEAIGREDASAAAKALADADELATDLEARAAAPAPPPSLPWRPIAGGVAALGVAALAYSLWPARPAVDKAATEPRAPITAVKPAARPQPTAPRLAAPPTAAAEPAPTPLALVRQEPTAAAAPAEVAPPPLTLASARPSPRELRVALGSEQRFEAQVRGARPSELVWELDGAPSGHGNAFSLGKPETERPGSHRLALLADRGDGRRALTAWTIDVTAPELGFAGLEPRDRRLERDPGASVSFRAPVVTDSGEKLSFEWEVNGKPARNDGPSYQFRAQDPGQYVVKVRAVAPWGASIDNTWNVTVRAVPTPAASPASRPPAASADAELREWIQAYCSAFERGDTQTLIRLGHLKTQEEADRLSQALSMMEGLKLSCTNPSIRVDGDEAVVSFDRTDHWRDPRGTDMERELPRITKTLHRANGRWVAVK